MSLVFGTAPSRRVELTQRGFPSAVVALDWALGQLVQMNLTRDVMVSVTPVTRRESATPASPPADVTTYTAKISAEVHDLRKTLGA